MTCVSRVHQQGSTGRSSPSNDRGYARRGEREGWGGLGGGDTPPTPPNNRIRAGLNPGGWVGVRVPTTQSGHVFAYWRVVAPVPVASALAERSRHTRR